MAPAGPVRPADLRRGLEVLESWGFHAVTAGNARRRTGYLAGDDEERLAGIHDLLNREVDALVSLRGGYGCGRLLPELPWQRLREWQGWVVGFSDITALHCGLAANSFPVATLHGPMLASLGRDPVSDVRLLRWLMGREPEVLFRFAPSRVVRCGVARGVAVGGNLAMLASMVGTPFEPIWSRAVVFLEDIGEPLYRLDRLLTQLRLASRLTQATAVVAGTLERCGKGEARARRRWREMLADAVPRAVVVEGLGFGHGRRNLAFPLGVEVEVDTETGTVRWLPEGAGT